MALRELSSLEKCLGLKKPTKYSTQGERKVPVLQNNNGAALVGLVTIASHLVHEAKKAELLGNSAEDRAVVQQWLEYRIARVDNCPKDELKVILKVGSGPDTMILAVGDALHTVSIRLLKSLFRISDCLILTSFTPTCSTTAPRNLTSTWGTKFI
ncbi:eukaryotic translation elongation factor 1 epsilon-1 isoform X2 [Triplophysa rosa]|uniref:eukaryotic translation elongation factor 1 epsilon-1 isoform X2 n=1 Tax=Triplophysa rosa TaxID=992332 RepID=UPI002545F360|nr:eukaryotic translation elongation factor 1 epsilon-1 isoform X2 [Triplophysa rosa]